MYTIERKRPLPRSIVELFNCKIFLSFVPHRDKLADHEISLPFDPSYYEQFCGK